MNSTTKTHRPDRAIRAYQEAANYLVLPASVEGNDYWVTKQDGTFYTVAGGSCDCPDFRKRGGKCKHIHLVELHLQSEAPAPTPAVAPTAPAPRTFSAEERAALLSLWD